MLQQIETENKTVNIAGAICLIATVLSILILFTFFSNGTYVANFIIR